MGNGNGVKRPARAAGAFLLTPHGERERFTGTRLAGMNVLLTPHGEREHETITLSGTLLPDS